MERLKAPTHTSLDFVTHGVTRALRTGRSAVRRVSRATFVRQHVPVVVLTYHRVTELAEDPFGIAVSPGRFREHLAFLSANLPVVRFEDDWAALRTPAVAITFDDGYADNYLEALPILEEFGLPATFFVTSGNIGTSREFWWDELERHVFSPSPAAATFTLRRPKGERTWRATTREERQAMYFDLHRIFKRGDAYLRRAWFSQLRNWSGEPADRPSHRSLSADELRALAASPLVTIGAHTVTHPSLGGLGKSLQKSEILQGKAALEAWTGKPVDVFAYPFGGPSDFDDATIEICRGAGLRKAATCISGVMYKWTEPYRIPRQMACDWDRATLAHRLADFLDLDRRCVAAVGPQLRRRTAAAVITEAAMGTNR